MEREKLPAEATLPGEEGRESEARRLHTLLLLQEHARTPEERIAGGEWVCRSLRKYLVVFHGLEGRDVSRSGEIIDARIAEVE